MRTLSLSVFTIEAPRLALRIGAVLAVRRTRQRLAQLDEVQLRDIGLTSDAAKAESRRPIWDAPAHWHR